MILPVRVPAPSDSGTLPCVLVSIGPHVPVPGQETGPESATPTPGMASASEPGVLPVVVATVKTIESSTGVIFARRIDDRAVSVHFSVAVTAGLTASPTAADAGVATEMLTVAGRGKPV